MAWTNMVVVRWPALSSGCENVCICDSFTLANYTRTAFLIGWLKCTAFTLRWTRNKNQTELTKSSSIDWTVQPLMFLFCFLISLVRYLWICIYHIWELTISCWMPCVVINWSLCCRAFWCRQANCNNKYNLQHYKP